MWLTALSFVGRYWKWAAIAIAVGGLYAWGAYWRHGAKAAESEARAAEAQADRVRREWELDAQRWNAERTAWDARVAAIESQAAADAVRLEADHARAEAALRERAAADLRRMRDRYETQRLAGLALAAASAAPAECRAFEADARLLPQRDAELLAEFGRAADRAVLERNRCAEQYAGVKRMLGEAGK